MFDGIFDGRRILVTGHTGFKGSWLVSWLTSLGADVTGYAIAPPTEPSLFVDLRLAERIHDVRADIRDVDRLTDEIAKAQGKDRTTKRKATVSSEDGPRPKRDTTTTKSTVKAEKDLCLKSIFVQWRGPKIFNDKNTPGHQACLDSKTCTKIHQPFKQMAKSDLQAAFAQGPTIFGADNWEAKNYAERLLADNSNSKFSCPYFPDGTPRTSDKVAEIRAKRGLKTQTSRKANGDN